MKKFCIWQKNRIPTIIIVTLLSLLIVYTVLLVILHNAASSRGQIVLIGHCTIHFFIYLGILYLVALLVASVVFAGIQGKQKTGVLSKLPIALASVIASLVILFSTAGYVFLNDGPAFGSYYTFHSPDGKYTLVAREWSFLLAGEVVLYERTSPFFVQEKTSFSVDDGALAISAGEYEITWENSHVIFSVNSCTGSGYWNVAEFDVGNPEKKIHKYSIQK